MIEVGQAASCSAAPLVRALLEDRDDTAGDRRARRPGLGHHRGRRPPANLPLWGGMGGAAVMGLGLALAQPTKRVLVITGDGEMLMGVGSLATIATQAAGQPLASCVLDNEHYGETGMQETATRHGVDLAGMAKAAGIADSRR